MILTQTLNYRTCLTWQDRIRQKRESLRISQEAVAYVLDMSQAAYSKIERNETKIKVDQLYKIADYFWN